MNLSASQIEGIVKLGFQAFKSKLKKPEIAIQIDEIGSALLSFAAKHMDLEKIEYICEKLGINPNLSYEGNFPIIISSKQNHSEAIRYLLTKTSNQNAKDKNGISILSFACFNGDLNLTRHLIEDLGFDFEEQNNQGRTSLHLATVSGKLDIIKYLISKGANIEAEDNEKATPLYVAALEGHEEVVKFFIQDAGANISIIDRENKNLLSFACIGGNLEIVRYLVEDCKIDHSLRITNNSTPFLIAVAKNHVEIVRYLAEVAKVDTTTATDDGMDAMLLATANNSFDVLKYLISLGLDINSYNSDGVTPLIYACSMEKFEMVKYICENASPDIEKKDNTGNTALSYAAARNNKEIIDYLLSHISANINTQDNKERTPLMIAILNNNKEIVTHLLEKYQPNLALRNNDGLNAFMLAIQKNLGIVILNKMTKLESFNIEASDAEGYTALTIASSYGYLDIVEFLVGKGANINTKTSKGHTPLMLASSRGHLKLIKYLINEQTIDLESTDNTGQTAFLIAAQFGKLEILKFLKSKGANHNINNMNQISPIHAACYGGHFAVVTYLAHDLNCDIEVQDKDGYSPLILASLHNHLDIVKYLVEYKNANIYSYNKYAVTAIHVAAAQGNLSIVSYLAQKLLDINIIDGSGFTPLHCAALSGKIDVVKYLLSKCGADYQTKTNNGKTVLDLAIASNNTDLIEYLVAFESGEKNLDHSYGKEDLISAYEEFTHTGNKSKLLELINIKATPQDNLLNLIINHFHNKFIASVFPGVIIPDGINYIEENLDLIISLVNKYPTQIDPLDEHLKAILICYMDKYITLINKPDNEEIKLTPIFVIEYIKLLNVRVIKEYYQYALKLVGKYDIEHFNDSEKKILAILTAIKSYHEETESYPEKGILEICKSRDILHSLISKVTPKSIKAQKKLIDIIKYIPEWGVTDEDLTLLKLSRISDLDSRITEKLIDLEQFVEATIANTPLFPSKKSQKNSKKSAKNETDSYISTSINEILEYLSHLKELEKNNSIIHIAIEKIKVIITTLQENSSSQTLLKSINIFEQSLAEEVSVPLETNAIIEPIEAIHDSLAGQIDVFDSIP